MTPTSTPSAALPRHRDALGGARRATAPPAAPADYRALRPVDSTNVLYHLLLREAPAVCANQFEQQQYVARRLHAASEEYMRAVERGQGYTYLWREAAPAPASASAPRAFAPPQAYPSPQELRQRRPISYQ